MPQVGEVRSGQTETVKWDGQRWQPVARDASAEQGYHPGLADSESPWLARLKGFFSGASEAATPAKIGTGLALATALPTAGLSVPAAALLGAGGTMAAEAGRQYFGTANRATSFPQIVGRTAETAAIPAIGPAIHAGARMIGAAPATVSGGVGALMGGTEGYRRNGALGALEGALVGGATGVALPKSIQALQNAFRGGAAGAEGAAAEGGFAMQPRANATGRTMNYGPGNDIPSPAGSPEDYWPARETEFATRPTGPTASSPRLAGKAPQLNDELQQALGELRGPQAAPRVQASPSPAGTSMTPGGKPAVGPDWYRSVDALDAPAARPMPETGDPSMHSLEPEAPIADVRTTGGAEPSPVKFSENRFDPHAPELVDKAPAAAPPEMPPSVQHLGGDVPAEFSYDETGRAGEPSYTDFAQALDDTINAAGPDDMPRQNATGLGRSRPTNAIKDWAKRRGYSMPGEPIRGEQK